MAAQVGVIAIRQAGSAAAFAPLVRRLAALHPERSVVVFCYKPARATWERSGLACHQIDCFADAAPVLDAIGTPAFVLTGTSLEVADDSRWWEWAAEMRCPSIAFVDQWVNYWQRFALSGEGGPHLDRLPGRVAVVDEIAADRMRECGCPGDRLAIAGSPAFDQLLDVEPARVRGLRDQLTEAGRAMLVVFACEPATPPQTSADVRRRFGFCEEDVVALTAAAAADVAVRLSRKVHLVFKLHPIQIEQRYRPQVDSHDDRFVSFTCSDGDRVALIAAADLVVGMRSMLLYEAALIGKPVISVQPQRLETCDLTDGRPGIQVVGSGEALRAAMFRHLVGLCDPRDRDVPGTFAHAAADHALRFAQQLELA